MRYNILLLLLLFPIGISVHGQTQSHDIFPDVLKSDPFNGLNNFNNASADLSFEGDVSFLYNDSVDDVYKVNPYTAPDDFINTTAPFMDITSFGYKAKKINESAAILRMNATFSSVPVVNASMEYFFQFSIQPTNNSIIQEIQFNFNMYQDGEIRASRQIFYANSTQEVVEYKAEGGIDGKTLYLQTDFTVPTGYDLTKLKAGDYLVRVDIILDLELNADTFNLQDDARFDFSINESGDIVTTGENGTESTGSLPAPIFGLILLLAAPILRSKHKKNT